MGISAVMACYNRDRGLVYRAISTLLGTVSDSDFRLILLDNHSPNSDVSFSLKSFCANNQRVEVVDPGRNMGKGRGFNYVWTKGYIPREDYVVVASDDIEALTAGWDVRLRGVLQGDGRMGSVSAFIESGKGMPDQQMLQEEVVGGEKVLISKGSVGGDLTMYRSGVLETAGLFAPTLYGHEDYDMALKLRDLGYRSAYVEGVKMNHYGHEDPEWTEWKIEMHDGRTGLQFPAWLRMREGNLVQKVRDVMITRFMIPLEGQRGLRR